MTKTNWSKSWPLETNWLQLNLESVVAHPTFPYFVLDQYFG